VKLVLAPIAGFTDPPFRMMCFAGGADAACTEMVSAAALRHAHAATRHLLEKDGREGEVSCQIFGSEEIDVAQAAREIDALGGRFSSIDLNAGCPMARITRTGAGAALVPRPGRIASLVKAMKENTSLPVTVKTRLGPRPGTVTVFEILDAAEKAGASAATVHARYTSQMHGGPVDLDVLAQAVENSRIPVAGNGSVVDGASAARMSETGVCAIAIARAAISKPWVFASIRAALEGREAPPHPSGAELFERHLALALEFRDVLAKKFPEDHVPSPDAFASVRMHTHLFRYFAGIPGAAALRARLSSIRTIAEMREAVEVLRGKSGGPGGT